VKERAVKVRCAIVGGGGHGAVLIEAALTSGEIEPVCVLDADKTLWGKELLGIPILGGDELLPSLPADAVTSFLVGVGGTGDNVPRRRLYERALAAGLRPCTLRHPSAIVSPSARLGAGTVVLAGAVVGTRAVIGANVIVNSGVIVEHDCIVGDHVHLASGATLGGDVQIGEESHIGAGATVREQIKIGPRALVAAGAVVVRHVSEGDRVAGVPASSLLGRSRP
jgi:sugar O-acyltransferase (sialic acid O-acetyltransferase NeuD family)